MTRITIDLPDEVAAALKNEAGDISGEFRAAAAAQLFRDRRVSQEVAAQISGMDRVEFMLYLGRAGIECIQVDLNDLDAELNA